MSPRGDDINETPGPSIKISHRRMIEEIHSDLGSMKRSLSEMRDGLYGKDPNKPHQGIVSRVAKLEERERTRSRLSWLAIATGIGAIGTAISNWLGSSPPPHNP